MPSRCRNPPWTWNLLERIWPKLQARVPPDWLPIRTNPIVVREHGEGVYGVVMPTNDPAVVFKITTDSTEAAFVHHFIEKGLAQSWGGIVRYFKVFKLGPIRKGTPKGEKIQPGYVLWRESVDAMGEKALASELAKSLPAKQVRQAIGLLCDVVSSSDPTESTTEEYVGALERLSDIPPLRAVASAQYVLLTRENTIITDAHLGNFGVNSRGILLADCGHVVADWDMKKQPEAL